VTGKRVLIALAALIVAASLLHVSMSAGVVNTSRNVPAAERFIEFLLENGSQQAFAQVRELPLVNGVVEASDEVRFNLASLRQPDLDLTRLEEEMGGSRVLLTGVTGIDTRKDGGAMTPDEKTTGILEVPGALLYYEVRGVGPLLVAVPGRKGNADGYQTLARELSAQYQVVTYDRRGFSRSRLVGAQDYDHRLATDADDVRRLIEHLSDEPATVFGSSSGALVALDVLTRHPAVVRTVIAHEPPAVRLLPDGEQWLAFLTTSTTRTASQGSTPPSGSSPKGQGSPGVRRTPPS